MNRTLLIARREFMAYAKTVGFWLSLLAFPFFAALGGVLPILMQGSQPVRQVVLIEDGPTATGLAAAVRNSFARADERRRENRREAQAVAENAGASGGSSASSALDQLEGPRITFVEVPTDLATAPSGEPREALARRYLGDDLPENQHLDAVVFLTRAEGAPSARVWSRRAADDAVEDVVRTALRETHRRDVFQTAGIDPTVVDAAERFRPEVTLLSPQSASGGEVSFRDRLPGIVGLASGFLLWSLVITGASILLNSVMEEKSNKILEVLLSSASSTELMTGKVLGVAMLTATVLLAWGGIGAVGLLTAFPQTAVDIGSVLLDGGLIFYFLAYAAGGYLMYAVLFAAIGAFCETPRDAQTLMGPIMMVLVIPIIVMQMALQTPDAPVVRILSWVPFFTPFLMSARAPSEPPLIEIVGTMGGMFAFALLMVWLAGRAFRAGALSDVKLSWKSFAGAMRGGR